jgi:DNA repair photolyase
MKFDLDAVFVEEGCRASVLARRIVAGIPAGVALSFVADPREATLPVRGVADPFTAGKRRMVMMRRRSPFLSVCPAASAEFACCGYLVLTLFSNCPMDCSYCFLQEYVADNPALQIYANYTDAFAELDRAVANAPGRHIRVGTGEFADSLAFDGLTGLSRELVEYFAGQETLTLELKTKTDEIQNLVRADPRGRAIVAWTLSPERVFRSSEHGAAAPAARIAAARTVLEAGYRVAFHFDPIIAYPEAEREYVELADELMAAIAPGKISYVSMGGLRLAPALRAIARRRFPDDPMLVGGEDVLSPDGRFRTFAPLRMRLYHALAGRFSRAGVAAYLCMENPAVHERVFGRAAPSRAALGQWLATR